MKYLLFIFSLFFTITLYAQDDGDNFLLREIQHIVTEPEIMSFEIVDTSVIAHDYHDQVYGRVNGKPIMLFNFKLSAGICGEGAGLAYQITPDSFLSLQIPFNHVGALDTVYLDKKTKALAIYGSISCYGSGGGVINDGFMIVSIADTPLLLFQVFDGCGTEIFGHGISPQEADDATFSYSRKIKVDGPDIIIYPNTKELIRLNKEKGTCAITKIASGTYRYTNGKYVKLPTLSKASKIK
jgi:hypothetical protein